MSTATETPKNIHQGRNVKRFREMLGLKQDTLASALGEDWNQKKVSLLEAKETIEEDILAQVSGILKVPVEAIKNLDEDQAITIIANTFSDEAIAVQYYRCTINAAEQWLESLKEIRQLHDENRKLYERLVAAEREKTELLKNISSR